MMIKRKDVPVGKWLFQGRIVNREAVEMSRRMVNKYKYHNSEVGLLQWKQETPEYIKDLENDLFQAWTP